MTPEVWEHLKKARERLLRARIILGAGVGEDAGRNAYLAVFHTAQAVILARSGRVAKTHRGVQRLFSQLAGNDSRLREIARFLSQAYNLKDIADYDLGSTGVSIERASTAIDSAEQCVEQIADMLT